MFQNSLACNPEQVAITTHHTNTAHEYFLKAVDDKIALNNKAVLSTSTKLPITYVLMPALLGMKISSLSDTVEF